MFPKLRDAIWTNHGYMLPLRNFIYFFNANFRSSKFWKRWEKKDYESLLCYVTFALNMMNSTNLQFFFVFSYLDEAE